jgi:hypothetical protein
LLLKRHDLASAFSGSLPVQILLIVLSPCIKVPLGLDWNDTRDMGLLRFCLLLTWLILGAQDAGAQTYSIDWYSIGGGGGTSTAGVYSVSGTIGQPTAGMMSGGAYSLTGGFWAIISAVQTPGSPLLSVFVTRTNTVFVSWPSPSTGFVLQQNPNAAGTNWVNVSQTPVDNGTVKSVLVNPPVGNLFFRLKQ